MSEISIDTINNINARLEQRRKNHPSFKLMGSIDKSLLPKGFDDGMIPNSIRTVEPDGGEPIPFGDFIRSSWNESEQCHLLITGEGGVGKTVAMLTLATEQGFLPRSVAAVYIPLYELSQYCGEGPYRDCVDRFLEKDFSGKGTLDVLTELADKPWKSEGGPNLILLLDGYNEIPNEKRRAVDEGVEKWASWPGVQVITTSRELGYFGVPHMRRLALKPLSTADIKTCLGADAPKDGSGLWKVIKTPLMLRLYANSVAFARAGRVRKARYLNPKRT